MGENLPPRAAWPGVGGLLASLLIVLAGLASGPDAPRSAPRLLCERPATLALHRFEDRSAQLLCGRRILVRVAVPG